MDETLTLDSAGQLASELSERIALLSDAAWQDVRELSTELRRPDATPSEREEVARTILEIIWPESIGGSRSGERWGAAGSPRVAKWSHGIGARLKRLRTQRRWTQNQLANQSDLPQSHISRIERGRHCPSGKTIAKLATALEVEPHQIDPAFEDPEADT